ncbi:MAG TPA: asparagine synthase (glutamine-hydrolyzing) [Bryobacteraceae bacterium]
MCGIAGFVSRSVIAERDNTIERMARSIQHRGPDQEGIYREAHAQLGFRRLAIIDLVTGQQPIVNETGDQRIIFNGEIFNHADLRPDLEAAGHRYTTRSDSETILHAYEQYGPTCVKKFRGMFAFAIWDSARQTLFAARDRLGKKPFYYYWDGSLFVFASEIKAILAHPSITATFEDSLLSEYLAFGYTSGDRTLFRGIRKLMPGHTLTLTPENLLIQRYWDLPKQPPADGSRPDEEWIAECRRRLEETVRMRLMSDVPLGMFLSGGVDSSAIAGLMTRMVSGRVKTFSVGYAEAEYSELGYARHVAESIGTDHHEVVVGMEDFFNAVPNLVWHEDEPITWPSSVSLYFVSRLASEQVKVVLTGEGSDEMFAGYSRYRFYEINQAGLRYYKLLPGALRRALRSGVEDSRLLSGAIRRKLQHSFVGRGETLESLYLDNFYSAFSAADQERLLLPGAPRSSPYDSYLGYWNEAANLPILQRLLYADQKSYLVELLMKQDQMSMACSIESRVPFLDHHFVEFAARVPRRLKIRNGEAKYILKRAVEDVLPRDIIYRRKMGFPTPLRQWLREPRAEGLLKMLDERDSLLAAYVNPDELRTLVERHKSGQVDATDRIWRLLNLQIWGDLFFTGRRERRMEGLLPAASAQGIRG